jgi:hypothetical protein
VSEFLVSKFVETQSARKLCFHVVILLNVSEPVLLSYFMPLLTYCILSITQSHFIFLNSDLLRNNCVVMDHLCDLVVRAPGYRSRGPGSIPGATRFSEK